MLVYDLGDTTPVVLKVFALSGRCEVLGELCGQKGAVGVSEAVDTLLGITDDEAVLALALGIIKERLEVLILHTTRVLELVDHMMLDACPDLLVEEGCIIIVLQ